MLVIALRVATRGDGWGELSKVKVHQLLATPPGGEQQVDDGPVPQWPAVSVSGLQMISIAAQNADLTRRAEAEPKLLELRRRRAVASHALKLDGGRGETVSQQPFCLIHASEGTLEPDQAIREHRQAGENP